MHYVRPLAGILHIAKPLHPTGSDLTRAGGWAPAGSDVSTPAIELGIVARIVVSLGVGLACGASSWYFWTIPHAIPSDFAQLWAAARGFLQGVNPYEVVGPGRPFEWDFPLLYP